MLPSTTANHNPAILARRSDPETSHQAAVASKALAERHGRLIVMCLQDYGPLGKDGIASRTGIDGVAVARRMPELLSTGQVRLTGKIVPSMSGRAEREWESTTSNN